MEEKEFTFIFMLYNLSRIGDIGSQDDTHISAVVDQLKAIKTGLSANFILIEHRPNQTLKPPIRFFKNTLIKEMEFDKESGGFEARDRYNFGTRNLGDEDSLAGIFLLIKEKWPSSKYVLFTYDHSNFIGHLTTKLFVGRFLSYIKEVEEALRIDEEKLNHTYDEFKKDNHDKESRILDFVREKVVIPDFSNAERYDMLTNAEFSNAIRKAFVNNEGGRMEAIFFDTCYTANLDNLYLYADSADYIIAAEGELHFNSFHIQNIVGRFFDLKDTRRAISATITNFEKDFLKINPDDTEYKRTILTAFDLTGEYRKNFEALFNPLLLDFLNDMKAIVEILENRFKFPPEFDDCFGIFNTHLPDESKNEFPTFCYDFFEVFNTLAAGTRGKPYNEKIVNLIAFLKTIMFEEKYTGRSIRNNQFNGLSLFLNRSLEQLDEKKKEQISYGYSFFSEFQNDFAKKTYWPEFIQFYQKLTNPL